MVRHLPRKRRGDFLAPVTSVTGNSEAFDNDRLRTWERWVAVPSVGTELVEAVHGLRQPHQNGQPAALPTCARHSAGAQPRRASGIGLRP